MMEHYNYINHILKTRNPEKIADILMKVYEQGLKDGKADV